MRQGMKMDLRNLSMPINVNGLKVIENTGKQALEDLKDILNIRQLDYEQLEKQGYQADITYNDENCIFVTITHDGKVIIQHKIITWIAVGEGISIDFSAERVI